MLKRKTRNVEFDPAEFPEGWDDPNSEFHIPAELRPFYDATTEVTRDQISGELRLLARDRAIARQREFFERGEANPDREARNEFENRYGRRRPFDHQFIWRYDIRFPEQRAGFERPWLPDELLIHLSNPTGDDELIAAHRVRLAPAIEAEQRQRRADEARARFERSHTCGACRLVGHDVRPRRDVLPPRPEFAGRTPTLCDQCAADVPLLDPLAQLGDQLGGVELARLGELCARAAGQLPALAQIARLLGDPDRRDRLTTWTADYQARCQANKAAEAKARGPLSLSTFHELPEGAVMPGGDAIKVSSRANR